jgi:phosphinothricin acetyltransferase
MKSSLNIRDCLDSDIPFVQAIYQHHVLHGTASFELEPPTIEQMRERRNDVLEKGLPYLVAQLNDEVVGYAYATLYRPRHAYRFTCEDSVYIRQDSHRQGIGSALLGGLVVRCSERGWRQMIAVIGDANPASIAVHARQGFELAGTLKGVGYKFDAWRVTTLMQRALGQGEHSVPCQIAYE